MNKYTVLVVEDDPVTSVALGKAIRLGVPDALVLSAKSLAEARLILAEYRVAFFILDINLPDGLGIDFIGDAILANAEAMIVLLTSTPVPEYRLRAQALGVMNFMTKPVDNRKLVALIKESRPEPSRVKQLGKTFFGASLRRLKKLVGPAEQNEAQPPDAAAGETTFFKASLSRLTVLDIIQLKCLSNLTQGMLFKTGKHGTGKVYFENGDIVHAETDSAAGLEALTEIIGWKGGHAEELPPAPPPARTISGRWQNSLLVAAHAADDKPPA